MLLLRSPTHSFINSFIYTLRDPNEDGAAEVLLSSALKTIQRPYRIYCIISHTLKNCIMLYQLPYTVKK